MNLFQALEKLYESYNKRCFVDPDPLMFLYDYSDTQEREIVAIIASSLAYGRVVQILKSVRIVLDKMDNHPRSYLLAKNERDIINDFKEFRHRFTGPQDISAFLINIRKILKKYGSLHDCFVSSESKQPDIIGQLELFAEKLGDGGCYLAPLPSKGSAIKRLNLFLRWMVRKDEVDPGGWEDIGAHRLIIPLDTHMFNISKQFGFTKSNQAGLKTAIEITNSFKRINSDDPVKYDFSLTRFGIRSDMTVKKLIKEINPYLTNITTID